MNDGSRLRSALGGLEAGVIGVLGMLATFVVAAMGDHRSYWLVPNLLATAFHGPDAYTASFTRSTLNGMGFLVLGYGSLGALWGIVWGQRPVKRLWLGGAVTGYLVYLAFRAMLWKNVAPLVSLYAPELQFKIAHLVWGVALGQSPRYAASIARAVTPPTEEPSPLKEPPEKEPSQKEPGPPPLPHEDPPQAEPAREEPPPLPETV